MDSRQGTQSDTVTRESSEPAAHDGARLPGGWWRRLGGRLLMFACYAALLDAGVETFLSGSPVRWWILAIVGVYLPLAGLILWRGQGRVPRFRPIAGPTTSLIVLLGLLAVTAWLPDGLTHGVVILGQPTARLLTALTGVAFAAAGGWALRIRGLPIAAKWSIGVLTLYGVAACVMGLFADTPYPALFNGEAFWARLPVWLQGTVFSTVVLVPIGLAVQVVEGARGNRGDVRVWGTQVLMLSVCLAIAAAGLTDHRQSITSPASPPSSAELPSTSGALPPSSAAAVASPDTASALEYAALKPEQQNAVQEYRAALSSYRAQVDARRETPRTVQTRIGQDPAALTRFVQDRIGYQAYRGVLRGAQGVLTARSGNAADRAILLAAMLQSAGHAVRFVEGTLPPAVAESWVRKSLPQASPSADLGPLNEMSERAADHFTVLSDALRLAGFKPGADPTDGWRRSIEDAQRHVWVQVSARGGWTDADPSPGVAFGHTIAREERTLDQLPLSAYHQVHLRLDVEWQQGEPATQTLVQFSGRAADLGEVAIGLYHERKGEQAFPVLSVGRDNRTGAGFNAPAGTLTDVLSRFSLDATPDAVRRPRAERLHVSVKGPSGTREGTLTIFDTTRVGTGAGGSSSGGEGREIAAGVDAMYGLIVSTGQAHPIVPAAIIAEADDPNSKASIARFLAADAAIYAFVRSVLPQTPLGLPPAWYTDMPNVIVAEGRRGDAGMAGEIALDLTVKAYRSLRTPEDPLGESAAFYGNLACGVLDHTVERWMLDMDGAKRSVGQLFERAVDQNIPVLVLVTPDSRAVTHLSDEGQKRLLAAVQSGQIVAVPARAPAGFGPRTLGWWTIDPRTGWTEDVTETGRHGQPMTEETASLQIPLRAIDVFCRYGMIVALKMATVSQVVKVLDRTMGLNLPQGTTDLLDLAGKFGPGGVAAICAVLRVPLPVIQPPLPRMPSQPRLPPWSPPRKMPWYNTAPKK